MKIIAITQRLISNQSYFEIREALDIKWGKLLKKSNFIPIILPIEFGYKKYFESIKIDGIILTGGNDTNVNLSIFDNSGRLLWTRTKELNSGRDINIETTNLKAGMYYIKVESETVRKTAKLVRAFYSVSIWIHGLSELHDFLFCHLR